MPYTNPLKPLRLSPKSQVFPELGRELEVELEYLLWLIAGLAVLRKLGEGK